MPQPFTIVSQGVPLATFDGNGNLTLAGVITQSGVVYQGQVIVPPGTSAGIASAHVKVVSAIVNAGDIALPNTAGVWALLSGIPELAVPAGVGDWVEISVSGMRTATSNADIDVAVVTGAGPTVARYLSSQTATPAIEGLPSWYSPSGFVPTSGPIGFTATGTDIDGATGTVRFRIAIKSAASGTLYASTNYPFQWRALRISGQS